MTAMDVRIELVPVASADVDRTKAFYERVGWTAEFDRSPAEGVRFVQVTPPGSACSFCFGTGLQMFPAGQTQHLQAVVADAEALRADLVSRGVECTEVEDLAWGRFVRFTDPDGNLWSLQQLPDRG